MANLKHKELEKLNFPTIRKEEIKDGYCILVSSHQFMGLSIQEFQKLEDRLAGIFNHAAVKTSPFGQSSVFEAKHPSCCFTDFNNYLDSDKHILIGIPKFDIDPIKFGRICLLYDGKRYEYENLLGHQIVHILTGQWIGRSKEKAKKALICGELVESIYNDYTLNEAFLNPHKAKPLDIYKSGLFTWKLLIK